MSAYESDTNESIDTELSDFDRPDDCQCWDVSLDLPCWPCYRAGFETPNPDPSEGSE